MELLKSASSTARSLRSLSSTLVRVTTCYILQGRECARRDGPEEAEEENDRAGRRLDSFADF